MMKEKKEPVLIWLFLTNFLISAFAFGGGYVVIPMIRKYFVVQKHYIEERELMDIAAIAQSSPGAIAINLAALAGYKTAKLKGAVISCIAAVLPPFIILSLVSACYQAFRDNAVVSAVLKGMEAGVAALIVDVVADMCRGVFVEKDWFLSMLVPVTFFAGFFLNINTVVIILGSALLCVCRIWLQRKKEGN